MMKYDIQKRFVSISFDRKPSQQIRTALKRHGFRWSPASSYWWRTKVTGAADLITWIQSAEANPQVDEPVNPDSLTDDPFDLDGAYEESCRRRCGL